LEVSLLKLEAIAGGIIKYSFIKALISKSGFATNISGSQLILKYPRFFISFL